MNKSRPKLLTFLVILIVVFFASISLMSNVNLKLTDNLYGGKAPLDNIVIVAIDDQSLQDIGRWPWDRNVFSDILEKLDTAKVIGVDVAFLEPSSQDYALQAAISSKVVLASEYISFKEVDGKVMGDELLEPVFDSKSGYVNIITDGDGVTRAVNLNLGAPSFAEVLFKEFWDGEVPKESRYLIDYVGAPQSFETVSVSELLSEDMDFSNKLVLIGATSLDLRDTSFVPTSKGVAMAGVEIHANTLQSLINDSGLKDQSFLSIILSIIISAFIMFFIFHRFGTLSGVIAVPVLIVAYYFLAIYVFDKGVILNLIYVPLTLIFTFSAEAVNAYLSEKKSKDEIKGVFSKYVSKDVLNEILKDPSKAKLGGSKETITVLFSDIRSFTTISESLKPEELVHLMNEYLTEMTKIIIKHGGVVDKYIGDAIMAFWGAPIKQKDHAKRACEASLEMISELKSLRKKWKKEGFPEINIGIGLSSGEAIIGNMGSYERFDYTAIGDTINIGARLESLTKEYKVPIIIGESVKKLAKADCKFLGEVKVKGKTKAIKIYELNNI